MPDDIAATARAVTAGATTPYAQAAALRDWFRTSGGFVYDTTVDPVDTPDAISAFLRDEARLLRAVRERVRRDGALAGHPGPRRGRLHARRRAATACST